MFDGQPAITGNVLSVTVNVVVQFVALPDASVAVNVTVVTPVVTIDPAAGVCVFVIVPAAVQLSVAVNALTKSGTVAEQLAFANAVFGAVQLVITGAVWSAKNTVNEHVDELPFLSVTVKVITLELTDAAMIVPAGMLCVTLFALKPQASAFVTLKVRSGNVVVQFNPLAIVVSPKQVITGAVTSLTVTTDVQVEVLPVESVTVSITLLLPTLLQLKVALFIANVTGEQLSNEPLFTIDAVMVAFPAASKSTVIGLHIAVGATLSNTVYVVVQVELLLAASVTVIVTVVIPIPTVEPTAGDCVITRDPVAVQLSLAVTVPVKFGTVDVQAALVKPVCGAAQVIIVGLMLSVTVNVLLQVVVLFEASFTEIVIVVTPVVTTVPAIGDCVITNVFVAEQLSEAITAAVKSGTVAPQLAFANAV